MAGWGGACQGLRTLLLGTRILAEEEWAAWNEGYQSAAASLEGREARIAAEASKVERELQLVGVTAIEDKLQDGVPEAIQLLVTAGIKARPALSALSEDGHRNWTCSTDCTDCRVNAKCCVPSPLSGTSSV